jgi:autophagy-related protein 17
VSRLLTGSLLCSQRLIEAEAEAEGLLDVHRRRLESMDELGEVMSEMIEQQQIVEVGGLCA